MAEAQRDAWWYDGDRWSMEIEEIDINQYSFFGVPVSGFLFVDFTMETGDTTSNGEDSG
ncbi:hypothetical protein [Candidatus Magnetominusculus dajiuhuensis]|uniref:hypothetical protein n=1 Tax=Candidatus Magnetominusculus dajiuhuensis TaxID=3137712 RepID=UPI003B42F14F